MLFNSIDFLIFFPIIVFIFFIIPKNTRYIWLLGASYCFYMYWNPLYVLLIIASTGITYLSSIFIERCNDSGNLTAKKTWVAGSLISNLGILALFKYANFFLANLNKITSLIGIDIADRRLDFLLPVGISFYTFQALSYTLDVYRGEIRAEKNPLRYALFVSFFPQLVAGPIERSKNLLSQIQSIETIHLWRFDRVKDGFLLMMWGFFQKLVIADRASILVDNVINHYESYGFVEIGLAAILFAFQIYCDFSGYTNIAKGAAKIMGFSLMDNFKQPYLATNIREFWRRWHISLTSWFTDYLYIPLGGNRKGLIRKYINIIIVFGISGLWHGASWNFVAWGLIHAVYQIIGDYKSLHLHKQAGSKAQRIFLPARIIQIIITFVLVDFAWIFFVSDSFRHALGIIRQMFAGLHQVSIFELGLDKFNFVILIMALILLLTVDILHEKNISITALTGRLVFPIRWILYTGFVWLIIMFGIYGIAYDTSSFIYFQF